MCLFTRSYYMLPLNFPFISLYLFNIAVSLMQYDPVISCCPSKYILMSSVISMHIILIGSTLKPMILLQIKSLNSRSYSQIVIILIFYSDHENHDPFLFDLLSLIKSRPSFLTFHLLTLPTL